MGKRVKVSKKLLIEGYKELAKEELDICPTCGTVLGYKE